MELPQEWPQTGTELAFEPDYGGSGLILVPGDLAVAEAVEICSVEETEISPLELFKMNFHNSVISIESADASAVEYINGVIGDLKAHRAQLDSEASRLERQAADNGFDSQTIERLSQIDEERVLIYYQLKWAAGYALDRSPMRQEYMDFFNRH